MGTTQIELFNNIKKYNKVIFVSILAIIVYYLAAIYNDVFNEMVPVSSFLTWHNIFELSSVLISFSIFTVSYFIYGETKNPKIIVYGCAFLIMGSLDALHTFSYKGMPHFFIANDTANRATTLWILSRTIGSLLFLKAISMPNNLVSKIKKEIFTILTIIFIVILFIIVTYYPGFFPPMYIDGRGLTILKIFLEYFIIFILGLSFLMASSEYNTTKSKKMYTFMTALVLLIFSEYAFTMYGSIYDAYNYIGHVYKIIAYAMFFKAIYLENVILPYRQMEKAKDELKVYSDKLNILVEQRTQQLENANTELERSNEELLMDIEYAKEMQRCLLPLKMPQNQEVSFAWEYLAAKNLSGDFYNVIKLDEDNIAVYIGDVSGHGISASMLTIFAYQNIIQLKEKSYGQIIEPGFVLKTIYKSFNRTHIDDEKYIVMLYGIYNVKDKSFTYSSAGLNVPPYIIKQSGEIQELSVNGFPICKLGDLVSPFYKNRNIQLEVGDKVLFYSDGLVEAKNENGQVYGSDRLKSFLKNNCTLSSSGLKDALKKDFYEHIGYDSHLMDDVTFLTMEVRGQL